MTQVKAMHAAWMESNGIPLERADLFGTKLRGMSADSTRAKATTAILIHQAMTMMAARKV